MKPLDPPDDLDARTTYGLPRAACMACGAVLENATNATDPVAAVPCAGDVSLCIVCGHAQAFTADLAVFRELTDAERALPGVQRSLRAWRMAIGKR